MEIKEITNKEIWENFLLECEEKTFLSSWNWGEFNKLQGNKIWRFGIFTCLTFHVKHLVGVAQIIKTQARRGTFLFLPHGPNIKLGFEIQKAKVLEVLINELKKIAKEEKASLARVSPVWDRNKENIAMFKNLGFRLAPIHMHAEVTWELDIIPSEEKLLGDMRKTTRYLIRKAQKDGVEIVQSTHLDDLEEFNRNYQETVDRHHFVPFSSTYLKNEFLAFRPDNQVSVFLGKYQGEIISSAMILFWSGIGFYHHGASSVKYAKIPASYLLQWEIIREAKKRGCKKYNFWGINPTDDPEHPWAGLTLFKMGFGGSPFEYVKTQDFPLSKKYWLTWFFEKLRKTKRGL